MSTISQTGITNGSTIDSDHVLRIIKALSGTANNDIIISGSLTNSGSFSTVGSSSLKGPTIVSGNLMVSGSILLNGSSSLIQAYTNVRNSGSSLTQRNILNFTSGLIAEDSGSVTNVRLGGSYNSIDLTGAGNGNGFSISSVDVNSGDFSTLGLGSNVFITSNTSGAIELIAAPGAGVVFGYPALSLAGRSIKYGVGDNLGNDTWNFYLEAVTNNNPNSGSIIFVDNRSSKKGIEYKSNYSASILTNDRSIPDIGIIKSESFDLINKTLVKPALNTPVFTSYTDDAAADSAAGGTAPAGTVYYNITTHKLKVKENSTWKTITTS